MPGARKALAIDETGETASMLRATDVAVAAKHHLAAAVSNDEDDVDANARHAFLAYRHQLNGAQYAEIAVMDNESLDDEFDAEATEN